MESAQVEEGDDDTGEYEPSQAIVTASFMSAMLASALGQHDVAKHVLQRFSSREAPITRIHPNVWRAATVTSSANSTIATQGAFTPGIFPNTAPEDLFQTLRKAFAPTSPYWEQSRYDRNVYYSFWTDWPLRQPTSDNSHSDDKYICNNAVEHYVVACLLPRFKSIYGNIDNLKGFEWWVHTRPHGANLGHQLHFDTDEALLEHKEIVEYPMAASVTYLTLEDSTTHGATIIFDQTSMSKENAEKGKDYSRRLVEKDLSRGKTTQEKGDKLLDLITTTDNYDDVKGADLVVEAVFENPELKAKITKMAEDVISADAIFGSNTSTLPITGLAEASQRPENFIGIHFFSPVERMGLVEIITGEKTSEETLAKSVDYVLAIKKTPIVVNDSRGFYTSRCFGTYTQEGMAMLAEGIKPAIIENVGRQSGMPMGALEVSDSVGLDTALKVGRQMAQAAGIDYNANELGQMMAWLVEDQGRVGRKAGKGFYDYNEKGKPARLWPDLNSRIDVTVDECPPELKKHLTNRFLVRQAVEVARCFEDGVITDARDADIGSLLPWGFAPYTGGCASYMDLIWGIPEFVAEADALAEKYGDRFKVPQLLRDMAANGETFYSRFPPGGVKAKAAA